MTTIPESAYEAAGEALEREGGLPGASIHGWRCEHPDRYGPCDCVRDSAKEIVDAAAPDIARAAKAAILREVAAHHREVRKSSQHPIWTSELDMIADAIEAGQ